MIDFEHPIDYNKKNIRRSKNQEVLRCHPDRNLSNLAAARETEHWNEAYTMATDFLRIVDRYDDFESGNAHNIISYMMHGRIDALYDLRNEEAQAELDAYTEEQKQNAINENEAKQRIETLYEGYDAEHLQQQQGMYMLVYIRIYLCIYLYIQQGQKKVIDYIYRCKCIYIDMYIL
jgi:hypothetical protein